MGLDMYLIKRTYVGTKSKHRDVKAEIEITINGKPVEIKLERISYLQEKVGYWRKANQIHNWFVHNCQDGVDDCREYLVPEKQLHELYDICKRILTDYSLAEKLLPTQGGFFFGDTNYEAYYFDNIENTIEILESLLSELEGDENAEILYYSSW